jgi:hypothetical protein
MIHLVSAQRPDPPAQVELWMRLDLFQRHPGPRLGNRIVNPKVGTQAVAVLHREVPTKAKPFAPHTVEGGQQADLEQLFGRDARTSAGLVELLEEGESFWSTASTWRLMARSG